MIGRKKTTGRQRSAALQQELPGWLSGTLILGAFATVLWFEQQRTLRPRTENKVQRDGRNLVVAALSAVAIRLAERPVTDALTHVVHRKGWGIVKQWKLPAWLEVALAVVLLDYTLYVWHVLTHKAPFLWRFHRVHHADLELDASTALRFHFAEMLLSVPWRAAQVVVIGTSRLSLSIWQTLTFVAILFHHSNVQLPIKVERWLCRLIMTPRMHGIHHSMVKRETDANWSTILAFPDYLHGTYRLNVPQQEINIGVPEYRDPKGLTLWELIRMPFGRQRPAWRLPDQSIPERQPVSAPREELLV
jgi:sterol desaturase/sphingolipid hydroxylase (fatty acid hydroxylase superfamily)